MKTTLIILPLLFLSCWGYSQEIQLGYYKDYLQIDFEKLKNEKIDSLIIEQYSPHKFEFNTPVKIDFEGMIIKEYVKNKPINSISTPKEYYIDSIYLDKNFVETKITFDSSRFGVFCVPDTLFLLKYEFSKKNEVIKTLLLKFKDESESKYEYFYKKGRISIINLYEKGLLDWKLVKKYVVKYIND